MKKLIAIALLSLGFPGASFAEVNPTPPLRLRITTFVYPHNGIAFAELCGVVENGAGQHHKIRALVDPGTSYSGVYTAETDRTGRFCTLVRTLDGRVSVGIEGAPTQELSVR
jgi:hypothetical protein